MIGAESVQILLGTYNYGRFLDEFLESLLRQTHEQWSLLVRDDASCDNTIAILETWRPRLGGRLETLPDSGRRNLGVAGNYSRLLAASSSPYVMFADPDDVWHADKIAVTLDMMRRLEARLGPHRPCLVHTDLVIVDEALNIIAPSLWRYQGLIPHRGHSLSRILVENTVWACTAMLNRALIEATGDIPEESHNQDWWVALVAAAFGGIAAEPTATLHWRRHGANDSQVSQLSGVVLRSIRSPAQMRQRLTRLFEESRPRANAFLARYRNRLTPAQIATVESFLALLSLGPLARRRAVLGHRLFFTSIPRNLGLLLFL